MPTAPNPSPRAIQEAAFAAAFPELADASTAQIRELKAVARGAIIRLRSEQRRIEAMQAWAAENLVPLPFAELEDRTGRAL